MSSRFRPSLAFGVLLTVAVIATQVTAQDASEADVVVTNNEQYGPVLTTPDGMSVYLYVLDEAAASTCIDACANNWPPLLAGDGEAPVGGDGVDATLLGTVARADGSSQVTYGGWPLYTFRRDTEPGHVRGQGLGDQFYLVSLAGQAVTEALPEEATVLPEAEFASLMEDGHLVFASNCAVCHGEEGGGGIGPGLAANSVVSDRVFVIRRVLNGFIDHGMPPFRDALSDHQIAAVATFIRSSWANDYGPVLPEEVTKQR